MCINIQQERITNKSSMVVRGRNCEFSDQDHMNPCRLKIFPFLFKTSCTAPNSTKQSKNYFTKNQTKRNSHQSSHSYWHQNINYPQFGHQLSKSPRLHKRSPPKQSSNKTVTKKMYNGIYRAQQTVSCQIENPSLSNSCSLDKYHSLQKLIQQNARLSAQLAKLEGEVAGEEQMYENVCRRYMEFLGSRNQNSSGKVRQLMGIVESGEKNRKNRQTLEKQRILEQLQRISYPTKRRISSQHK